MNARKNIDYELPTTSEEPSVQFRGTQSLDVLPTSFRIDGSDVGQLEVVYRSLGFDSPEDFGIDLSSWEARKIRSISDLNPSSSLNLQVDDEKVIDDKKVPQVVKVGSDDDSVRVSSVTRVGNGIKGVRPPVLSPPDSSISKPLIHHDVGCEWDNVRTFASGEGCSGRGSLSDEEEEEEGDAENVRTRMERTTFSTSCSFTTSNEDDSSSTTTEPPSSVSPNGYRSNISANGRFRHIPITHWQRGELLGRGSFGSVYEGICE